MKKKLFIISVLLVLLMIFIVPKGKNDKVQINTKQYSEGSGSKTAVEYLKEKSNSASITNYNDGNKVEMYAFNHEETYQTPAQTDYRYIGNEPNNYVKFNCNNDGTDCEIWRILGVFNVDDGIGNYEQRIKLVRSFQLEDYMYWNNDSKNNDWTDLNASLKNFLNGDYYNRSGNAVMYGLKTSAQGMIDDTLYYLGGTKYDSVTHYGTAEDIYNWERGNIACGACNNDSSKLTWIGKVALMYPSDFYMVYGKGVDNNCYTDPNSCSLNDNTTGSSSIGWIFDGNKMGSSSSYYLSWFLSPYSESSGHAFIAENNGNLFSNSYIGVGNGIGGRPVLYLKSNIYISDGDGSSNNPYFLSLTPTIDEDSILDDSNNDDLYEEYVYNISNNICKKSKKVIGYNTYNNSEIVEYDSNFYIVVDNSFEDSNYVTLFKLQPLTVKEVYQYGSLDNGELFVNKNTINTSDMEKRVYEYSDGNGGIAYYNSDTCKANYRWNGSGMNIENIVDTGCSVDYDHSDIKKVVDNWAAEYKDDLVEIDGYKSRLITLDELLTKFYFTTGNSYGARYVPTTNTPKGTYGNNFEYWTMSHFEDGNQMIKIGVGGTYNYMFEYGAVKPVINLNKCALEDGCIYDEVIECEEINNTSKSKIVVNVENTLSYISWAIIIISGVIVILGCSILGYNFYKSRKERK